MIRLTRPELQEVVQRLYVSLKVHGAGDLFTVCKTTASSTGPGPRQGSRSGARHPGLPRLLCGRQENRPETHGQILTRHSVAVAVRRHQTQMIQQEGQSRL